VEVGGLPWTLKNLLSGNLSEKEGIRYPGRIWIAQLAQVVVTIVLVLYAVAFIMGMGRRIDDLRDDLGHRLTPEEVEKLSNYEWATITVDDLYVSKEEQFLLDILPKRW
jgi:hypothetical protein